MDFDLTPYLALRERCLELRRPGARPVDEDDVATAESLVGPLVAMRAALPGVSTPPDDARLALKLLGWAIYEFSWALVQRVPSDWHGPAAERRAAIEADVALLVRTEHASREVPWPEFAPRALGAIRAHALEASKRNTPEGYDEAESLHLQARSKQNVFRDQLGNEPALTLALDEVFIQLELAETGTACREPERIVSAWEQIDTGDARAERQRNERELQRMFRRLRDGAAGGDDAVERITTIDDGPGLAKAVDEDRLLTGANVHNPGIMTARAHLILLPMTTAMQALERSPIGYDSWDEARVATIARAETAYRLIERHAAEFPLAPDHRRSVIQLRLNFAFACPGRALPTTLDFADCLRRPDLDADAVEEMSQWLSEKGQDRGDANIIGSAMMPLYLASLRTLVDADTWAAYVSWRRRWPGLDRYAGDPTRGEQFEAALACAGTYLT